MMESYKHLPGRGARANDANNALHVSSPSFGKKRAELTLR